MTDKLTERYEALLKESTELKSQQSIIKGQVEVYRKELSSMGYPTIKASKEDRERLIKEINELESKIEAELSKGEKILDGLKTKN